LSREQSGEAARRQGSFAGFTAAASLAEPPKAGGLRHQKN
jgi:hypothetical protein